MIDDQNCSSAASPLDEIEDFFAHQDIYSERHQDHVLAFQVKGLWTSYNVYFSWNPEAELLELACLFNMPIPSKRREVVFELLSFINTQLLMGHFEICPDHNTPCYRYGYLLSGMNPLLPEQIEHLIDSAVFENERFYPAFQFAILEGKNAEDAANAALINPIGEA